MFDNPKKELHRLQEQLLAEEEDYEEEYEEYEDEDFAEDFAEEEELLTEEEEDGVELFYRNHANGYGTQVRNYANRYGRGQKKQFDYLEEDEETDDDRDYLFRQDSRKGSRRSNKLGWLIIGILEVIAIGAIGLWWLSWMQ